MTLTEAEARALVTRAFMRAGVPETAASDAAEILTLAEMMCLATHGLNRVSDYVTRIAAGGIDPKAEILVDCPAPAIRQLNGQNGLGPAIARRALSEAMDAARAVGVGVAICKGGNHLGALAPYLWIAAEAGFASIMTTTTAAMIAPAGGRKALVGNNPMGIGVPNPGGPHAILDMALSVAARSKVRAAAETGTPIPDSWATDATGNPTTDPKEAMRGLMQAIGGAKGANLALCLDLLVGGLSGATMLSDIQSTAKSPGTVQGLGQLFLLIDTSQLLPDDMLSERMETARQTVGQTPPVDPDHPVRIPGARAIRALKTARTNGLSPSSSALAKLYGLANP